MRSRFAAVTMLACMATAPASADIQGSLSFRDPTGTATAVEAIPVWVVLTLDPASDPLAFDALAGAPFGLPESWIPTHGEVEINGVLTPGIPFASIDSASFAGSIRCGSFNFHCSGSPYRYDYAQSTSLGLSTLSMAPGESREFLFNHLVPNPSPAPPGTYQEVDFSMRLAFYGTDADGNFVSTVDYAHGFSTFGAPSFVRTITAVPEPSVYAMMLAGLGFVALASLRSRAKRMQEA
ncbi:MAG: PEP-CTERM sorting domain-containing protein [Burkholderiales bacterium]|nr:PEP-CTERM sorting domain-containing protein [Burkholderiales bacterium]